MTPYASAKSRYLRLELFELGSPFYGRGKPGNSRARRWYRNQLDRLLRREAREEIASAIDEHRSGLDETRTRRKVDAMRALGYDPGEDDGDWRDALRRAVRELDNVAITPEPSSAWDWHDAGLYDDDRVLSYDWDTEPERWDTEPEPDTYAPEPVELDMAAE